MLTKIEMGKDFMAFHRADGRVVRVFQSEAVRTGDLEKRLRRRGIGMYWDHKDGGWRFRDLEDGK